MRRRHAAVAAHQRIRRAILVATPADALGVLGMDGELLDHRVRSGVPCVNALDVPAVRLQHGPKIGPDLRVLDMRHQRLQAAHDPCLAAVEESQALLEIGNRHGLAPERTRCAGRRASRALMVRINMLHQRTSSL